VIPANGHDLPTVVTSNWTERAFALYHSRIASRLKAIVHVRISAAAMVDGGVKAPQQTLMSASDNSCLQTLGWTPIFKTYDPELD